MAHSNLPLVVQDEETLRIVEIDETLITALPNPAKTLLNETTVTYARDKLMCVGEA